MPWYFLLAIELLKVLPVVIRWLKEHPLSDRKDLVAAFPDEVKGLLKKLKDKREGVGSAPDLVA